MAKHFQGQTIDGKPQTQWPAIHREAAKHKHFTITVLSENESITDRQRRWYKGICLRDLVKHDENGETAGWWDTEVKRQCNGLSLLKKEIFYLQNDIVIGRLTTKGVSRKRMTDFIEEIISKSMEKGWDIGPPDKDLRRK